MFHSNPSDRSVGRSVISSWEDVRFAAAADRAAARSDNKNLKRCKKDLRQQRKYNQNCGADPLVRCRPPGRLRRDEGVPRGPGGPPYFKVREYHVDATIRINVECFRSYGPRRGGSRRDFGNWTRAGPRLGPSWGGRDGDGPAA